VRYKLKHNEHSGSVAAKVGETLIYNAYCYYFLAKSNRPTRDADYGDRCSRNVGVCQYCMCANTAERIEVLFGEGLDFPRGFDATFAKLLWLLVIISPRLIVLCGSSCSWCYMAHIG